MPLPKSFAPGRRYGAGTSTSTDTAYTGSGILGGSGAGSASGGPRRLGLTGSQEPDAGNNLPAAVPVSNRVSGSSGSEGRTQIGRRIRPNRTPRA